jgi:hypothetical protein
MRKLLSCTGLTLRTLRSKIAERVSSRLLG